MIVTPKKLAANRANAQKSTGPRTPDGKRRSSLNAVTHGIFSERTVLPDEERSEFAALRARTLACLSPHGIDELMLCEEVIRLTWRLRRLERVKGGKRLADAQAVKRFIRYEQRLVSAIERCMDDFVKLRLQSHLSQSERSSQGPLGPSDAEHPTRGEGEKTHRIGRIEPNRTNAVSAL